MRIEQATCVFLLLALAEGLSAEKQYKSPEEYNLYTAITGSLNANDAAKAIAGLDAWKQKFPDSDFASNRQLLYVQAYSRASQPGRAIEAAQPVLHGLFDSPDDRLRLIYAVAAAVQKLPSPDETQRRISADAAKQLLAFDTAPPGVKPEEWEKARAPLQNPAKAALIHIALTPVRDSIGKGNCAEGESGAKEVIREYPMSVQAAWVLGSAELCLARRSPEKFPSALYAMARAAALDPAQGFVDPEWQKAVAAPYLEKIYAQYHGADPEGLRQLKSMALTSPLPPEGFTILSATQIEQQKQAEFESRNPELALWTRIRAALTAPNGESYFTSELKDAAVPPLAGTLVAAKPACQPRELMVAIGGRDGAEIVLKLSRSVAGKPEPGSSLRFKGVASAFTRDPFLLTMVVDTEDVVGLKTSPCSRSPRKR